MTTHSTAGVGLDRVEWLGQVATEHDGAEFCVAAAVAAHRDSTTGFYGATKATLARFARVDADHTLWSCIRSLTSSGFLDPARRGGGRGRPALFRLEAPALFSTGTAGGEPVLSPNPPVENRWNTPSTAGGEPVLSPNPPVENRRFGAGLLPIELLTTTTGGGGDHFVVDTDVLEVVLAELPAELRPRTAAQRMQMAADIARWLGAGWTAVGIGARARQALKPGHVKFPDKMLALLVPPAPPGPIGIVSSKPPDRCAEHLQDEPCRGCVIDRQLGIAAARGAS